jgi:hypothetical protein
MNARLLKNLKHTAAYALLISVFTVASVPVAQAEMIFLFRSADATVQPPGESPRTIKKSTPLKLDDNGDLLIQYGNTRFIVAYNAPTDQFKPSEQQQNPTRERSAAINGISLTASLSF